MAERFRFRLEAVARLRKQKRDEQARRLSEAVRDAQRIDERVGQLTEQLRDIVDAGRESRGSKAVDIPALRGQEFYRGWLQRRIFESRHDLALVQERVDKERSELAEAMLRVKVLEKLRDRQWQRYRAVLAKEEQQQMDEVAVQRYLRCTSPTERDLS